MDFFRRIDKDQDGKITRQEFIDGILASSEWSHASKQGTHLDSMHSLYREAGDILDKQAFWTKRFSFRE